MGFLPPKGQLLLHLMATPEIWSCPQSWEREGNDAREPRWGRVQSLRIRQAPNQVDAMQRTRLRFLIIRIGISCVLRWSITNVLAYLFRIFKRSAYLGHREV